MSLKVSRRLGATLMAACVLAAAGTNAKADLAAQGAGTDTCQQMFEQSATKWKSNRDVAPFYQSWFHGFISGMNVASYTGGIQRAPLNIGPRKLRNWVSEYCKNNPNDDLLTVAVKLFYNYERNE